MRYPPKVPFHASELGPAASTTQLGQCFLRKRIPGGEELKKEGQRKAGWLVGGGKEGSRKRGEGQEAFRQEENSGGGENDMLPVSPCGFPLVCLFQQTVVLQYLKVNREGIFLGRHQSS